MRLRMAPKLHSTEVLAPQCGEKTHHAAVDAPADRASRSDSVRVNLARLRTAGGR